MNSFLSKIVDNPEYRYHIFLVTISAFSSAVAAWITQNVRFTIFYIFITWLINVCAIVHTFPEFEQFLQKILSVDAKKKYSFFLVVAVLPAICGFWKGDLCFSRPEDYFSNLVPNICGALIVCSLLQHVSKFKEDQIVLSFIHTKKEWFDCYLPIGVNFALLNAINYELIDNMDVPGFFNLIHLSVTVFFGSVTLIFFAILLIDRNNVSLEYTAEQLYPKKTLIFALFFLLSCGLPSLIFESIKNELFLLWCNTLAACIIAWAMLLIIRHRTSKVSNKYPLTEVSIFTFFAAVHAGSCTKFQNSGFFARRQIVSGLVVVVACILIVYLLNKAMKIADVHLK